MNRTPNTPANGGQILTWHERINADPDFIGVRSKEHMFDYLLAEIAELRASLAAPATENALNGIAATMRHDAGAFARCSYCHRYSLDPATLSDRQPVCECGKQHGWCGSFVRPDANSTWSGKSPAAPAIPTVDRNSVPEGWKLVPIKPTEAMMDVTEVTIGGCYSCSATKPSWGECAEIYADMLAAAPEVAQPAAQVAVSNDQRDAARWRAMLNSQRIRMIGSAGLNRPEPNNYAHFGMEIWTQYGSSLNDNQKQQMVEGNAQGRDWLTKYADIAIEAQRATPATVKTAEWE